jgi:predicted transcriptional regulator
MEEANMTTVTIEVATRETTNARVKAAFEGKKQGHYITFPSLDLMWKTLNDRRWEILRIMTGAGPMSIRELSRRLKRDFKGVHGDVQALLNAGVVDREGEQIVFPYDEIRVSYLVKPANAAA